MLETLIHKIKILRLTLDYRKSDLDPKYAAGMEYVLRRLEEVIEGKKENEVDKKYKIISRCIERVTANE